MSAEYEIIKYQAEHKPLVADLQRELWSTDVNLNTRYFEWKYEQNPYLGEPLVYLAIHQGKLVGMRGFHEARLEAGTPTHIFPVLIAGDAFVAPAHRDRSLVTRIMKMADADLVDRDYSYVLSIGGASPINALGLVSLGWKSAGMLQPLGRATRIATLIQEARNAMGRLPLIWRFSDAHFMSTPSQRNPFRHLDKRLNGGGARAGPPIAVEREPRVQSMAALVQRLGHDGRIRYTRDHEYLAWRFANPLSDYRFLYWEERPQDGYLVLNRRVSDLEAWDRVYIADLEATDMRVRRELISAAIRWGRFPKLVTWAGSLGKDEIQLLTSQAFIPVDRQRTVRGCPCILVHPLRKQLQASNWMLGGRRILGLENWDFRVLYSMRG